MLGITHIPETEAVQHLTLAAVLQLFTIRVCTSELHLTLPPEHSCSTEGMQKRDQVSSAILPGAVYFSLYISVLLVASTLEGLSIDHSDITTSTCMRSHDH